MAITAQQTSGFVDPYNYNLADEKNFSGTGTVGRNVDFMTSGIPGEIAKLFGVDLDRAYSNWQTEQNQKYERASIESARAWSEYMDNTQIQRRVKDIEAAGLNPWLAVQNGLSGTGAPSADTGGTAQHTSKSGQSKSGLAMLLMALVKLLG